MESDDPEAFREEANLLQPGSLQFRLVTENFENDVNKIIKIARHHAVPIIFFEGLSRWKDYEPVVSLHDAALTKDMLLAWERYFSEAESLFAREEHNKALALYYKCIDIDPSYALAYYRAAECYERLGQFDKANKNYILANDNDYFPLHAPSLVNRFYENIRTADMKGVDVIQTQKLFEENSPNGIVDENLTIDQIHPSPEGQALMALEIAKVIYKNNLLAPREKWQWNKLRSINEMKKTLYLDSERMFHIYTGTASYLTKHYREAAKFLEKASTIKPKSVFVRSWLAWTYWKMGELEKAMVLYRDLYRERPSLASAFFKKHPDIEELLDTEH
ncbi:MAG: tetratricopeptide repeat protein [Candidatus Omnitrophica bacterium]|nr:tetratricopeptide repeat protein [Candidatus Omnitrophota bacterium]